MNVVLDRPNTRIPLPSGGMPVITRPRIPVEPERRPVIETPVPTPAPTRVKRRSKTGTAEFVVAKALMFAGFFAITYVCSTLGGQYLVEKSRDDGVSATSRASVAVQAENDVRRRLDTLTSSGSIEDWALSHGFHPTDGLGQTSKVVNLDAINP